jgi:cyanophycinase
MDKQVQNRGVLIPIGGNEDKGGEDTDFHSPDFIDEGILAHIVREAGGADSDVVVIPTASSIPVEVGENYTDAFSKLGCHVSVLDIQTREQSGSDESVEMVRKADCIMFSGGDQSRIADIIGQTKLHDVLLDRYHNDGLVIAGTSAGAMCMSNNMIAGGSSTESFIKGAVLLRTGMSFLPELIIDTHFIKRGRFGRLSEAIATFPSRVGVGLAEDTGLIIRGGDEMTVIGSGMIIVFDPGYITHNNHAILREGTPMSMSNLKVHILSNGDRFSLGTKEVSVLPIQNHFI